MNLVHGTERKKFVTEQGDKSLLFRELYLFSLAKTLGQGKVIIS